MVAKNPRLNITVEPMIAKIIITLAQHEDKSISGMVKELIIEALERREDMVLSTIAEKRESKNKKKISHVNAWK